MPPVSSPGLHDRQRATRFTTDERAARVRFRRAMALMVMTLVLPGSAQLVAGNRRVGRIALRVWLGPRRRLRASPCVTGLVWHEVVVQDGLEHRRCSASCASALMLRRDRLGRALRRRLAHRPAADACAMNHRRAVVGVNGVLCLSVAGSLLFGAHIVGVQRDFMLSMFGSGSVTGAHDGRYNVLLLGGDSGAGRWGLRPDSMTIASIDAETGRTVLISLPRNMTNFPFVKGSVMRKQFPHGFDVRLPERRQHLGR